MANVSFKIQIGDGGGFRTVSVDAAELGEVLGTVKQQAKELNSQLVNTASKTQLLSSLSDAAGSLAEMIGSLTAEFYEDEAAQTLLASAMRNTMSASDDEVKSILDLIDAQERLGVISGGAQAQAAQELATYLEYSDSLKTLIPVLNDMGAQQLGLGASGEQLTQIASMLGKVMNGQVEALSRYGYKFDEAQKYILKFGDEAQRAATLAEVVSESVGGMNADSAKSMAGQMENLKNRMDGFKASVGKTLSYINPFIQGFASLTIIAANITALTTSFKALAASMSLAKIQALGLAAAEKLQAAAAKVLGISTLAAKTATGALRVEIIATEAAITLGLSLAISALVEGLARLIGKSDDTADAIEDVASAQKAYDQASYGAMSEIAEQIVLLEDLIKKKKNEGETVERLNQKYGEAFGTYSTAAEWYDTLTAKSAEYCKQLGYEAMAASYRDELADALKRQAEAEETIVRLKKEGAAYTTEIQGNGLWTGGARKVQVPTEAMEAAEAAKKAADDAVNDVTAKMNDAMRRASEIADELKADAADVGKSWKEMSLADLTKAIQLQEEKVKSLAGTAEQAAAREEAAVLKAMKVRKKALESSYGIGENADKDKYNGDALVKDAKSYEEIGNNIKFYQKRLEGLDKSRTEEIASIVATIEQLKKEQQAIADLQNAAAVPAELKTLEDIDAAIKAQQGLRSRASKENISAIDAELKRLEDLKQAFENASVPQDPKTLTEFNDAISYQQKLLDNAQAEERAQIEKTIQRLSELKTAFEQSSHAIRDVSQIGTIQELEQEISYYSQLAKGKSADEIVQVQRTIDALEAKKRVMEQLRDIPSLEKEVSYLGGLSDKELKVELELIGYKGLKSKIRELQALLDNTSSPLSDEDAKHVRGLIAAYDEYGKVLAKSNVSFTDGWSNVKGIGNSIKSLTSALTEDGNAWDKLCTIVDSLIGIYEGIEGIVGIIKAITGATDLLTMAKAGEAAATQIASTQAVIGAGKEVAASGTVVAAKELETQANIKVAASGALAAHSWLPFVGIALGLAAIGAMVAAMSSLPKFAKGGLVYGPTLGLMGEYSGASTNPEVIAPLSKLRDVIGGTGVGGDVEFRISGRDLYGVLKKQENYLRR